MPVGDLNELARKVKYKSQHAVKLYSENPQGAIVSFKQILGDAGKLKTFRKRDETVAISKLNLAAAQIGTGDIQLEYKGKETLEEMKNEGHTDNLLLASISFHLGLVSPRPDPILRARDELISLLENLSKVETDDTTTQADDNDRRSQRINQERQIQEVLGSFNATQLNHLNEAKDILSKCTTSAEELDVLVIKERIHEKRIQIWDKDLEWLKEVQKEHDHECLRAEAEDIQKRKLSDMEDVEKVYGELYGLLTEPDDRLHERPENVLHKHVFTLLRLGHQHADGGPKDRIKAKKCADKCYNIFENNWAAVDMSLCNDLGIIYSQLREFDSARQCFLMLQNCSSNHPADKSYIFQNLGSVMVLKEMFEDAIHYFKDALHILEGMPNQSERRAHLYANLGFTFSQMGRGRIWKAFEGYYNAAKCASEPGLSREENLRSCILKGLTLSARVILDYREEIPEFIQEFIIEEKEDEETTESPGEDRTVKAKTFTNLIEKYLYDGDFSDYVDKLKKAVLNETLSDNDKRVKAEGGSSSPSMVNQAWTPLSSTVKPTGPSVTVG